jgi:hypothetical protein
MRINRNMVTAADGSRSRLISNAWSLSILQRLGRNEEEGKMSSNESYKSCQLITLANGPLLRVERCLDCGTISLHLGAVSLRLDRSAAESLWTTLGQGLSTHADGVCAELGEHRRFARA